MGLRDQLLSHIRTGKVKGIPGKKLSIFAVPMFLVLGVTVTAIASTTTLLDLPVNGSSVDVDLSIVSSTSVVTPGAREAGSRREFSPGR